MTPPKDYSLLVTDPKDMEICDLPNKEYRIATEGNSMSYKKTQKDNPTKPGK